MRIIVLSLGTLKHHPQNEGGRKMQRKTIGLWLLVALLAIICASCGEDTSSTPLQPITATTRNADPCNAWSRTGWQEGPDAVRTPQLKNENASHSLSPAEIIYYSAVENSDDPTSADAKYFVNPVLLLTYLENRDLISKGKDFEDFEFRLLQACGYGGERIKKYHGFYPQLVASTYQWHAYQERKKTFEEAQASFPFTGTEDFKQTYAKYARIMNFIAGTSFSEYPDSDGYYRDFFRVIGIKEIQKFLETMDSPLKDKYLFREQPVKNTVIDYSNMSTTYCE